MSFFANKVLACWVVSWRISLLLLSKSSVCSVNKINLSALISAAIAVAISSPRRLNTSPVGEYASGDTSAICPASRLDDNPLLSTFLTSPVYSKSTPLMIPIGFAVIKLPDVIWVFVSLMEALDKQRVSSDSILVRTVPTASFAKLRISFVVTRKC